jgi:DNA polymerase elongation subunit (family B)
MFLSWNGSFDWKFIFDRVNTHFPIRARTSRFFYLGRRLTQRCVLDEVETTSNAHGTRMMYRPNFEGRCDVDMMVWVSKNFKLPSYKLGAVSMAILKEDKFEMDIQHMFQEWENGNDLDIFRYCGWDTKLPLLLWLKLLVTERTVQMARLTSITHSDVFVRGNMWSSYSFLLRESHMRGYCLTQDPRLPPQQRQRPTYPLKEERSEQRSQEEGMLKRRRVEVEKRLKSTRGRLKHKHSATYTQKEEQLDDKERRSLIQELTLLVEALRPEKYKGATVLDAIKGIYHLMTTLDFKSLYPSIMIAFNLCFSTLVLDPERVPEWEALGWTFLRIEIQPDWIVYYNQDVKGLLPGMCKKLLDQRQVAKNRMKECPAMRDVYDGLQLALKISANSIYGATGAGAETAKARCLEVAASVTSQGRGLIMQTKALIEDRWGDELGLRVVYGDTDSVMYTFDEALVPATQAGVNKTCTIGVEAAAMVTAAFPEDIILEFETVAKPFSLLNKKRYAYIDALTGKLKQKGVMSVRRDYTLFQKAIYNGLVHNALVENDLESGLALMVREMNRLIDGQVPLDDLVKSCRLKAKYAKPLPPQQNVVIKMEARSKGSGPKAGSRVQFVMTYPVSLELANPLHVKNFDLAEDVEYARDHGLAPDVLYYLKNIKNAVLTFLEPYDVEERVEVIFDQVDRIGLNIRSRQADVGVAQEHVIDHYSVFADASEQHRLSLDLQKDDLDHVQRLLEGCEFEDCVRSDDEDDEKMKDVSNKEEEGGEEQKQETITKQPAAPPPSKKRMRELVLQARENKRLRMEKSSLGGATTMQQYIASHGGKVRDKVETNEEQKGDNVYKPPLYEGDHTSKMQFFKNMTKLKKKQEAVLDARRKKIQISQCRIDDMFAVAQKQRDAM